MDEQETALMAPRPVPNVFEATSPGDVVQAATVVATRLRDVVREQKLISNIKGREHPKVEAWTLLGSMLGVFPVVVWSRRLEDDEDGWEARVEARTRSGEVVGAAEAMCTRAEQNWESRDDYALRSMAQTRAVSKALRMPLGFVMTLAGYDPGEPEQYPGPEDGAAVQAAPSPSGPGSSSRTQLLNAAMKVFKNKSGLIAAYADRFGAEPASLDDIGDEEIEFLLEASEGVVS